MFCIFTTVNLLLPTPLCKIQYYPQFLASTGGLRIYPLWLWGTTCFLNKLYLCTWCLFCVLNKYRLWKANHCKLIQRNLWQIGSAVFLIYHQRMSLLAMQEEALKLVLLALEDGSALSRKVLVLFVVQRLEPRFPQASKTSIGHVVQLLYRASCFKVSGVQPCKCYIPCMWDRDFLKWVLTCSEAPTNAEPFQELKGNCFPSALIASILPIGMRTDVWNQSLFRLFCWFYSPKSKNSTDRKSFVLLCFGFGRVFSLRK